SRRVPDVFADVHGEGRVARDEDRRLGAGLEVAVLVEDAVVRQVLLVIDPGADTVVEHRSGIEDVVALVHEAHHDREPPGRARHLVERAQVRLDERGLEQEVFGRVAADRELGKGHQGGSLRASPLDRVHDHADVAFEIANRGIDLPQGDPQAPHGPYCTGAGHRLLSSGPMPAKIPWLPSSLPPNARPERCPNCGRLALIPWTLRRDDRTKVVLRTWVCTESQVTQERLEPE